MGKINNNNKNYKPIKMANPLKAPRKTEILLSKNKNDLKNRVIYHAML